jgi:hypothetical protein
MHIEYISSEGLKVSADDSGRLAVYSKGSPVMQMGWLPFTTGFEQPFPYADGFKEIPLNLDLDNSPKSFDYILEKRSVKLSGDALEVSLQRGRYSLSQRIYIKDGACVIESFANIPAHNPLPRTFDVIEFPQDQFKGWQAFTSGGKMGAININSTGDFPEGSACKSFFAVQNSEQAVIIYSDTDSPYYLNMGCFRGVWHGMVELPAEPAGERLALGRINIRPGESAETLLIDFAQRTSAGHAVKPAPKCWNSWDYYHSSISHENIIENARAIADDPVLSKNIDCIVMDMGWEVRFGEWTADPNFPDGMAATAKAIRNLGFEAGLWFAPIILDPECNFFQDDYNWVGKNRFGFPDRTYECCGLFGYVLDVTRPEGEEYLFNLFKHYKEIGYTYFKLDFLRYAMYVHRYTDASMTNVEVMRKSLKIIRAAVGEDAYILGCNLPFEVGPGYCDACRVSGDVSIFWDNIKRNARSICCTAFWNGRWWANDPDFLVVRGRDTYTGERLPYNIWWFARDDEMAANKELLEFYIQKHNIDKTLSLEEARTHASLELLNGGAFVLADPVMYLNEAGKDLVRRVLSAKTSPGRPVDIFADGGLSRIWVQKLDDRLRIGLFNWKDTDETIELTDEAGGFNIRGKRMVDFWTGEEINAGKHTFNLLPHTCKVLEVMYY